jgi:hypothetical protein
MPCAQVRREMIFPKTIGRATAETDPKKKEIDDNSLVFLYFLTTQPSFFLISSTLQIPHP